MGTNLPQGPEVPMQLLIVNDPATLSELQIVLKNNFFSFHAEPFFRVGSQSIYNAFNGNNL